MESGVEVLAHNLSLVPLSRDLFLSEGLEHDKGDNKVDGGPVSPGGSNASSNNVGLVSESHVKKVSSGKHTGEEGSGGENSLGVVHSIDDSSVLLPLVCVHLEYQSQNIIINDVIYTHIFDPILNKRSQSI